MGDPPIPEHGPGLEGARRQGEECEGQVEHSPLQGSHEIEIGERLVHLDADVGEALAEPADQLPEQTTPRFPRRERRSPTWRR
jgi:hypothetical protein